MPWEQSGSKITGRHRERLAVVYVRQSTRGQVAGHQESTRLQYALVDRAAALGWEAARVLLIDNDLGKSGSSAEGRSGFQRMVTEISLGHVGLVLGTEMSRLARSGKDWYQLLELCALGGALLADTDGVYDPTEYNDRLLLGLKGTMSEAELYLINQRMRAGRINKARRGELAIALPIGYWRRPSGEAMLDPDGQVQHVVRLVFATFAELGSVQGVLRFLVENGIEMGVRARGGPDKGEVVWKRPARATITCMLNSPVYAGVYVYGRRPTDSTGRGGRDKPPRRTARRQEYLAWIEDALPAYISLAQYEANLARLKANRPRCDVPGAVRYGPALLAGLLRCERCGRRMTVGYHVDAGRPRISYNCYGARSEWCGPHCQHLVGRCLDAFVTDQVLAALSPAAVEVSIQAVRQALADRAAIEKVWQQRRERARQDADRARRCYRLAEPENRLVVRQLEKDWEQALAAQRDLDEQWHRFQRQAPEQLAVPDQEAIRQAAADLPRLWEAPGVTHADRKEVIRAVLDEITVNIRGVSELVDVTLHWAGGHTTTGVVRRPIQYFEYLSYYPHSSAASWTWPTRAGTPRRSPTSSTGTATSPPAPTGRSATASLPRSSAATDIPSRTDATRCPSTPPKHHAPTSGGYRSSPPTWAAPPAPSASGSARATSSDAKRPVRRIGGSCTHHPRRSTTSATSSPMPAAARPASTPASPKRLTATFHRCSLLDSSRTVYIGLAMSLSVRTTPSYALAPPRGLWPASAT